MIILSGPDKNWNQECRTILLKKDYQVQIANNGRDCLMKIDTSVKQTLLLDVDTADYDGLETLKYIRMSAPQTEIILIFNSEEKLASLQMDPAQLKRIGATDILVWPFSWQQLISSIEGTTVFSPWKSLRQHFNEAMPVDISDSSFSGYTFENIKIRSPQIYDVFIRLGENNYVKIMNAGDFYHEQGLKKYAHTSDISKLYCKNSERTIYINLINELVVRAATVPRITNQYSNPEQIVNDENVRPKSTRRTANNAVETYIENVYTDGVNPTLVEEGKKLCTKIYDVVMKRPDLTKLIALYDDTIPLYRPMCLKWPSLPSSLARG